MASQDAFQTRSSDERMWSAIRPRDLGPSEVRFRGKQAPAASSEELLEGNQCRAMATEIISGSWRGRSPSN